MFDTNSLHLPDPTPAVLIEAKLKYNRTIRQIGQQQVKRKAKPPTQKKYR